MHTQWSRKHSKCLSCGTKEIKHRSHGICAKCYHKAYRQQNKEIMKERNKLWMREYRKLRKAKGLKANNPPPERKISKKEERNRRSCKSCGILYSSPCCGKVKNGVCESCREI